MDKRVKNTTKALKRALFDMLEQMPLSKITVTSLCKQAGVNRVTFYHHFTDVYDMISQIELSYVEELRDYNTKFTQNGKVNFLYIVRFVRKYSDFYKIVFTNNIPTKLLDEMYAELKKEYCTAFGKKDIEQTKLDYMYTFTESGVSSILKKWVRGGMAESEEYIADLISKILLVCTVIYNSCPQPKNMLEYVIG